MYVIGLLYFVPFQWHCSFVLMHTLMPVSTQENNPWIGLDRNKI